VLPQLERKEKKRERDEKQLFASEDAAAPVARLGRCKNPYNYRFVRMFTENFSRTPAEMPDGREKNIVS
jgi:hypothetical protein